MFDLTPYNLTEDITSKVQSLVDADNVTIESLVEVGVSEDTAKSIVDDYAKFKGTDNKGSNESETDDAETEQAEPEVEESEQSDESDSAEKEETTENKDSTEDSTIETSEKEDEAVDYKSMYEELLFKTLVANAIQGLEFTSSFAKDGIINLIKDKNLNIVDGQLEGVSELIEQLKNEYPDAFKPSSNKPIFGKTRKSDSSGGSSVATFLSERYKNNPYYKG